MFSLIGALLSPIGRNPIPAFVLATTLTGGWYALQAAEGHMDHSAAFIEASREARRTGNLDLMDPAKNPELGQAFRKMCDTTIKAGAWAGVSAAPTGQSGPILEGTMGLARDCAAILRGQ